MQKKRLDTLIILVTGLITWKKLSVTELGRGINLPIQERSAIRRADRFIGNQKLHKELDAIYRKNVEILIGPKKKPKIIADWTHIPNTSHHALRAALVLKGRALALYEEVYPEKKLGNTKIEKNFLEKLNKLLPEGCKPIIITDAGFRNPWFKKIIELNWDYVGRVRGTHKYYNGNSWLKCKDLLSKAKWKARYIGKIILCKGNSITSHLFLLKGKNKKKVSSSKYIKKKGGGKDSLEYRRSAKENWLLASSIAGKNWLAINRVIKIYKMRMQIEEGFRDLKSSQYGFGFEKAHSRNRKRIRILLLVAMFASLIAWLVGYIAEKQKWHYQFQVNSIKTRRVLSLFYLGCQVIRRNMKITIDMLEDTVHELWEQI
ncbi:MAG TPA: IS4 family transposase [Verrucomicrobiae bacterium]|nr:IS4 family transposase [Verrucomicrobiae bacterium]